MKVILCGTLAKEGVGRKAQEVDDGAGGRGIEWRK